MTTTPFVSILPVRWSAVAALVAVSGLPLVAQDGGAPPPPAVRVSAVVREEVQEHRQVTGNLRAISRAKVAAVESGRIVEVAVRESDRVQRGQVLARIDDRRLRLDLEQADAERQVAEAELEIRRAEERTAKDDLESYRAAAEGVKGSVSALTIRAAERDAAVAASRVLVAERGLRRLQARVDRLRLQVEETIVRAPFDGIIVSRDVQVGEWANPGDSICALVSTGRIEAWLDIPERYSYAAITEANQLEIEVGTLGVRLAPLSKRVIPDVDPRSRRYTLIVELEPGSHPLAPGMSVTAQVPSARLTQQLRMPTDAVLRDGGGYFVYKVVPNPRGDGQFVVPVTVTVGFGRGDDLYVDSSDLVDGDRVVVEGNERLRPMSPVRIATDAVEAGDKR